MFLYKFKTWTVYTFRGYYSIALSSDESGENYYGLNFGDDL